MVLSGVSGRFRVFSKNFSPHFPSKVEWSVTLEGSGAFAPFAPAYNLQYFADDEPVDRYP